MSRAKRCDYCERFFTYDKAITIRNAIRFGVFNYDEDAVKTDDWVDVCPICMDKMVTFINTVLINKESQN